MSKHKISKWIYHSLHERIFQFIYFLMSLVEFPFHEIYLIFEWNHSTYGLYIGSNYMGISHYLFIWNSNSLNEWKPYICFRVTNLRHWTKLILPPSEKLEGFSESYPQIERDSLYRSYITLIQDVTLTVLLNHLKQFFWTSVFSSVKWGSF